MKLFVVCMELTIDFDHCKHAISRKVALIAEDPQQALGRARVWLEEIARSPEQRRQEFSQPLYRNVLSVEIVEIDCFEIPQGLVVIRL